MKMRQRRKTTLELIALIASQNLCSFARQIPPQKRVTRQAGDDGFGGALQMVQLGVKYLPVLINLFSSFTGSDGGASGGIGGGGGGGGGILDLVGGLIGGV